MDPKSVDYSHMVATLAKPGQAILDSLTPEKCHLWHMASCIPGEAGELFDAVKKAAIYNKEIDRANVVEELGDLEFYMEGLRQGLNITREETLLANVAKLGKRYEDFKYTDAAAQNRADKVEVPPVLTAEEELAAAFPAKNPYPYDPADIRQRAAWALGYRVGETPGSLTASGLRIVDAAPSAFQEGRDAYAAADKAHGSGITDAPGNPYSANGPSMKRDAWALGYVVAGRGDPEGKDLTSLGNKIRSNEPAAFSEGVEAHRIAARNFIGQHSPEAEAIITDEPAYQPPAPCGGQVGSEMPKAPHEEFAEQVGVVVHDEADQEGEHGDIQEFTGN